jgi:probable rRNA maturation factor
MARRTSPGNVDVLVAVSGAPGPKRVADWVRRVLVEAGAPGASLSVLLCGDRRVRTLNREFRDRDRPTDVLSFPSGDPDATMGSGFLGDIVIGVPYAARQARAQGHAVAREVQILLVHGILHLLGHDHERDGGEMFRLQARTVNRVFGKGPDGLPEGGAA